MGFLALLALIPAFSRGEKEPYQGSKPRARPVSRSLSGWLVKKGLCILASSADLPVFSGQTGL